MGSHSLSSWFVCLLLMLRTPDAFSESHVLLIAVSDYPRIKALNSLNGTANDAVLLKSLLTRTLSKNTASVDFTVLSENEADQLPTRRNIESAFHRLAIDSRKGDQVVVYISGHGSQQPARNGNSFPEPDGLDEIFLPRDVEKWDGRSKRVAVPNAITDDEFAAWFTAIRAKGARLFVIFDCCHAGHMTRSVGEVERSVSAEALGMADVQERQPIDETQPPVDIAQDGMAILYACDSFQKAIELPLPNANGKQHGLLTWSLASVLAQADGPLSYRELTRRIHCEYVKHGRQRGPTPIIEGGDIDREVLGDGTIKRPAFTVTELKPAGTLWINAGQLHALQQGAVLAVSSQAESAEPLIGHIEVKNVELDRSEVKVIKFGDHHQARISDVIGKQCRVVETNNPDFKLKLAIDATVTEENLVGTLKNVLMDISDDKSAVVESVPQSEAEWLVTAEHKDVFLIPVHDALVPGQDISDTRFGPFLTDAKLGETLGAAAFQISRARNLLKLAAGTGNATEAYDGVSMEVVTRVFESKNDRSGRIVQPPFRVSPGNRITHHVANIGSEPFDLTVLEVDSRLKITSTFPTDGRPNRFQPDDGPRTLPRRQVSDATFGSEYLVFLAVKATGPQSDFTSLEQPAIKGYRSSVRGSNDLNSLLESAMYGIGKATRAARGDVQSYQFLTIPMTVLPGQSK